MKTVLVHPFGNENVRQTLTALSEHRLLSAFITAIGWTEPEALSWLPPARSLVERRLFPMIEKHHLHVTPTSELIRNLLLRAQPAALRRLGSASGPFSAHWVAQQVETKAIQTLRGLNQPDAVYGYSTFASRVFSAARERNLETILEVPHVHWATTRHWAEQLEGLAPGWAITARQDLTRSKVHGMEDLELALATRLISPSAQVTESLRTAGVKGHIKEIPYGCPQVSPGQAPLTWDGNGPLKVLFVGRIVGMKGIADVVSAAKALSSAVHVTAIGQLPGETFPALEDMLGTVDYRGTMPRSEILVEMRKHHVLLLPSIVEGRSLAALEGLSQGLPAVVTAGSGVDDLVAQGAGAVVDRFAPDQIAAELQRFVDDPGLVQERSAKALEIARASGWEPFREGVAQFLHEIGSGVRGQ
ncbi:glycosyltransferase family 4 protein [Paenarthrobacter aurescens]|jgi:glycosyltransferase involved in cell wall biosynthesis|uniref:D-inositol 3-phosphate glycosyltransferase n=1 Tax=Paenarthrobacter aurescens (strain TC1) TaxID=290340 RepID=A1RC25_PAEAT|nr:glycosyltransferase [Paenarthrobacter aurescens]ABM06713.1 putative glycosyl transferase, group 1 family protein [Paenarthrobacter aurescens TC1]